MNRSRAIESGFSLIELLVGLAIGAIGLLVVSQAFVIADGQKRRTSSGADSQTTGVLSTFILERDIRQAGYGITDGPILGCTALAVDKAVDATTTMQIDLAPVRIIAGAGSAPDTIRVSYSTSESRLIPAQLTSPNNGNNANYKVNSRAGFCPGDVTLLAEEGNPYCVIAQVTGIPGTPGQTDNIIHNPGNYDSDCGAGPKVDDQYNPPGGVTFPPAATDTNFGVGTSLYNLGALPITNTYAIQNAALTLNNTPIAENVVNLKGWFGKDTNNDGVVDTFDKVTPTTPAGWRQIRTLRFATVIRGQAQENTLVTPATLPLWSGTGAPTITLSDAERRYRYRVYQTTVPLRNLFWANPS
ncbi:PilW family protein [Chitinimonas sp. BJYL2]|uniref:PilW family protein n=1 Tax=Chitinimonas sp. BJYL2 TaxID=2976696 RepID=UPI0022B44BBA|nr:PilW family protein [Chitinimonas sp. BJYL2]